MAVLLFHTWESCSWPLLVLIRSHWCYEHSIGSAHFCRKLTPRACFPNGTVPEITVRPVRQLEKNTYIKKETQKERQTEKKESKQERHRER